MTETLKHAVNQRTFIKASPEKVFDTITNSQDWNTFFTSDLEVDPVPGGVMIFRWKDWGPDFYTVEVDGRVLIADRPKLFSFEWGNKLRSTVEFHLEEKYGGTVVHVKEFGYPNNDEGIRNILECASGWGEAVTLLKFYIEKGIVYTPPQK